MVVVCCILVINAVVVVVGVDVVVEAIVVVVLVSMFVDELDSFPVPIDIVESLSFDGGIFDEIPKDESTEEVACASNDAKKLASELTVLTLAMMDAAELLFAEVIVEFSLLALFKFV